MKGRIKRPEDTRGYKLPRVGKVKTGFKNSQGHPRSADFFIPTGKYAPLFRAAYGDKPQTIHVVFWEDDPESMCQERYEYRDAQGKLYAKGDGEIFEVWNSKQERYVEYSTAEHPDIMDQIHNKIKAKGWDVILTLRFLLPKVREIAGYWEYSTKGIASTIPAIRDMFDAMIESRGSIRGVLFDLNVEYAKSQKPGVKSRYPVVSLVPNQSQENLDQIGGTMLRLNSEN